MSGGASPFPSVSDHGQSGSLRDACPTRPYVLALLVALYWPLPLAVRANSLDGIMPSPVQMAPSAAQSLDTGYGTAGVSMWYQRERSLVPAPLMALMR